MWTEAVSISFFFWKIASDEMSKSSRILELVQLVNKKQTFTVAEMAQELGVSYRTMQRYLEELSVSGIPLYSEPGKHGGYRLLKQDLSQERRLPVEKVMDTLDTLSNKNDLPSKTNDFCLSNSIQTVVKPSFYLAGKVIKAPYPALQFIQSMLQLTLLDLEKLQKSADLFHEPQRIIGLMKKDGGNFICILGFEWGTTRKAPHGLELNHIPVQHYAHYVHDGGLNRINIEETYTYIQKKLKELGKETGLAADSFILIEPFKQEDKCNIYIPLK